MSATRRVILAVDDEPAILKVLEKALARAGYSVILAPGPQTALKRARLLASERPGLPVLLTSGYSPTPSKPPFLAKPFGIDILMESVSNVSEGPPAFDGDSERDKKTSSRASLAGS